MKPVIILILFCFLACNTQKKDDSADTTDSAKELKIQAKEKEPQVEKDSITGSVSHDTIRKPAITYSNKRFKDVTVRKQDDSTFIIRGRAQVFEAAFSWVVEDGHEELQQGHAMADAGAPAFGNFNFTVHAKKKRPGSTLHLLLFESSPKDGSRQYELKILL